MVTTQAPWSRSDTAFLVGPGIIPPGQKFRVQSSKFAVCGKPGPPLPLEYSSILKKFNQL
jgi:hypothetical protein